MKRILAIILLLILLLGLIMVIFLMGKRTKLPGQAAAPGKLSLENSYLFASPLVARAGGEEKITVSVFVLSDQGLGIAGKTVNLYSTPFITAVTIQNPTDTRGLAVFEITSLTLGQFNLWATTAEGQIKQQAMVTFD